MRQRIVSMIVVVICVGLTALYGDQIVMLDPGHGGPGAGKYGYNGDGYGTAGPNGLSEKWVNLQVALKADTLFDEDYVTFPKFVSVLTRDFDTTHRYPWERVQKAKDFDATYFLSIHHNGDINPSTQGHEVYWSDSTSADWWCKDEWGNSYI
jgi:N-acetylmuramoyl-L-alanine amidase